MWKRSLKTFRTGSGIWVLFALGLLIFLLLKVFRKNPTTSPGNLIAKILGEKGYSSEMIHNWVAVSAHETGRWTSNLFRNANNLFGMKQPLKRYSLSTGPTSSGFATFSSQSDSVLDLVAYMEEFNYPKSFDTLFDQITFMKSKGYFQEPLDQYYYSVKKLSPSV